MAVRAQTDQIKLRKLNSKYVESTTNESTTYVVTQSAMEKLPLVVTQSSFHTFSTADHTLLRPEVAIILKFCVAWQCDIMEYFVYIEA